MDNHKTISDLRNAYLSGETTPDGVLSKCVEKIEVDDEEIHAFIDLFDSATEDAAHATALLKEQGEDAPPLAGIPVAIKNNILVEGECATAGSNILENYRAPYSATVVKRLKEAGAVLIGSTNLDEFAMGSSTEHSAFGPTKNPHDTSRVPGGSSGGSAAAVGADFVPVAIGTDTGGSIRQPASFCGVVGLKPTYGAVSRYGLIAMGSSLDQAGPLTHSVADAEAVFAVLKGPDAKDATTYGEEVYPDVSPKETYRIGVPRDFLKGVDAEVLAVLESSIQKLAADGHEIVDITLPSMEGGLAAYYIVMPAEVSSNMARYDGVRFGLHVSGKDILDDYKKTRKEGFGEEVQRRILLGTYVLSSGYYDAYYKKAECARMIMREELDVAFSDVDLILTPTTPTTAFKIGEKQDPLSMYLSDVFTVSANLTGNPAISLPAGIGGTSKLPVAVQCIAPHAGEARLFDIGKRFLGEV